jgi:hypothetical protein
MCPISSSPKFQLSLHLKRITCLFHSHIHSNASVLLCYICFIVASVSLLRMSWKRLFSLLHRPVTLLWNPSMSQYKLRIRQEIMKKTSVRISSPGIQVWDPPNEAEGLMWRKEELVLFPWLHQSTFDMQISCTVADHRFSNNHAIKLYFTVSDVKASININPIEHVKWMLWCSGASHSGSPTSKKIGFTCFPQFLYKNVAVP